MAYEVVSFDSEERYRDWLQRVGGSVRIVNVAVARKNWSLAAGFFTKAQTYTVTYERVPSPPPSGA